MTVIDAATAPRFGQAGTEVVGLAAPSRGSEQIAAWRLRLDPGTSSPAHSLDREEVFVVLAGRLRLTCDGLVEEAAAGGAVIAPIGREFQLTNPGAVPLDAVACAPAGIQATVDGRTFAPPWAT